MQFLTALLAFAGVMALLSTIIAVGIEAFIGARGMRRQGLERLLAGYYREAVLPRLPPNARPKDSDVNRAAAAFASSMTRNPARLGRSGRGSGAAYQHLTPRQLIEQLARTDAGGALRQFDDRDLGPRLEALAYEFDRYSEGARTFFTRRTRAFAIVLAIIFGFALNVDALRLYKVLANDSVTREAIITWADAQIQRQAEADRAADEMERARQLQQPTTPRTDSPEPEGASSATGADLPPEVGELSGLVGLLGAMSIPVGYSQYPYCLSYSPLHGRVVPGTVIFDPRCSQMRQRIEKLSDLAGVTAAGAVTAARASGSKQPAFLIEAGYWLDKSLSFVPPIYRARIHFDTWVWFFSTLVAGGMIGLGAPFWFNVYRRIAMLIPVAGAAQAIAAQFRPQPTQGGEAAPTQASTPGRRDDANIRGGSNLVQVMRTSAGESPPVQDPQPSMNVAGGASAPNLTGSSPAGGPIGAGSAQRIAAGSAVASATSGEPFQLRRRLRG